MVAHLLVYQQRGYHIAGKECIDKTEIILIVQHVEIGNSRLVGDVVARRCCHLVEYRQGIAHRAVGLLSDNVECCRIGCDALLGSNIRQLLHHVVDSDAIEVVNLATAQNRGYNLVLLSGCEYEYHIFRWLFKRLEEGVERCHREHMHLVDDKHAILAQLWRYSHLVGQCANAVDRVVGSRVELHDVHRATFVESLAGFALVASFAVSSRVQTVDGLGKDTGARCLSDTTRSAEKVGLSQTVRVNGILECRCQRLLSHYGLERRRAVFSCRYDVLFH